MKARTATLLYRDDGPVARAVGGLWNAPSPPLFPTMLGVALPFAVLGAEPRPGLSVFAAGWCAIIGGLVAGHAHAGRLDWLVVPMLRAAEYAFIGGLGLGHGVPPALVLALLGALAFHHYDTVYRVLQRREPASPWLGLAALGWDGRMLVVALGVMAGVPTVLFAVLTGVLWLLFLAESTMSWVRGVGARRATADVEGD
ncbi:MAG: DUF5941 domain-containing protein [Streptosporangiaceae bacterium]